jgi:hypothetical protein
MARHLTLAVLDSRLRIKVYISSDRIYSRSLYISLDFSYTLTDFRLTGARSSGSLGALQAGQVSIYRLHLHPLSVRNMGSFSRLKSRSNRNRFQGIRNGHLTRRARKPCCSDGRTQNLIPRTRCKDSSKDRYKRFSSTDHRQGAQAISSNYQRSVRRTSRFEQENGGDEAIEI